MQVDFDDRTELLSRESSEMIQSLLLFVAKEEKLPANAEISVSIVNNQEIKELNFTYRQKDQATDVLSFALQDNVEGEVGLKHSNIPFLLGDIIISIDKAKEQAAEYNHTLKRELGFLAVHGFLHLLGYDHMNEIDEREMFEKQNDLLIKYGLER